MFQNYQPARAFLVQVALFSALFLCIYTTSAQTTRYVKQGGTGNGSSWATASDDLQLMINQSQSGDQVWVAKGTYYPNRKYAATSTTGYDVDNTFTLKTGVNLYGSFAGTEMNVDQRKIEDNPTILSGDYYNNDANATGEELKDNVHGRTENAHHVVIAYGYVGVFDGFQIHGGNASGTGVIVNDIRRQDGGGMYIRNSGGIFRNVIVKGSRARSYGGAIYVQDSSARFINLDLIWCYAAEGGGIYFYESSSMVINSIINGCHAGLTTGGGGAIAVESNYPAIRNCVVYGNTSPTSGAAFSVKSYSGLHVMNCIVHGNGPALNKRTATVSAITYYNSNVQENGVSGISGGGNISADPKFVDAGQHNFRLMPDSPSINTGKDQHAESVTDKAGNPRFNGTIDMGPYEYYAMPVRYVKPVASGTGDGSSWANASGDLQLMINTAVQGDQIWVASGKYVPRRPANNTGTTDAQNRLNAFVLKNGVNIYGGFAGTEEALSQRVLNQQAPSVLSGDLSGDDTEIPFEYNGENAYNVVIAAGLSVNTVIDGFTISGGNAYGASMSSLVINGAQVASYSCGGINSVNSKLTVVNATVKSCTGWFGAGGIYIYNGYLNMSYSTVTDCTSKEDGGIYVKGSADITNCIITKCNSANYHSSALHVEKNNSNDKSTLTNVTIAGCTNVGNQGNLIYSDKSLFVRNSITYFNRLKMVSARVSDSNIEGSKGSAQWDFGNGDDYGGNIDENPRFVNFAAADFRLQPESPCRNAGKNTYYQQGQSPDISGQTKDLGGNARIDGCYADMGAFETIAPAVIRYVKPVASGSGDGSSWANASADLQLMINNSAICDQVWVARGTFKPLSNNIIGAFVIKNGVNLFGGFTGIETALQQRVVSASEPTLLSVDYLGDDIPSANGKTILNQSDNDYHVVIAAGVALQTVFDGFQVSGANAWSSTSRAVNGRSISNTNGGGIYMVDSDLIVNNCIIGPNRSNAEGAGIYCIESKLKLTNSVIAKSSSYNSTGALHVEGEAEVINCLFIKCHGGQGPGAISAAKYSNVYSETFVTNSVITQCGVSVGDRILKGSQFLRVRNSIIYGNDSKATNAYMYNCIVEGSGGSSNWNTGVYGNHDFGGNIDANPLFTNAAEGDFTLQAGSPAIDAGDNSFAETILKDIAGNNRIYGTTVDMGVYEYSGSCTKPLAPVAINQEYCTNATVAELTAQGTNLKWYTTEASQTPLDLTAPLTIGTYYVSQTDGTCESERTAVYVNLKVCGYITILSKASCGSTVAAFTSPVFAKKITGATNYRFRLTRGSEVQTIESPNASFKFNQLSSYGYGKTYTVDVAVYINGSWQAYGPTCTVTTPVLPVTTLRPENCGITVPFLRSYLYARKVALATNYRFRVTNGVQVQLLESPGAVLKLNSLPQYDFGMTYTIEVAAFIEGAWGDYGDACTVTTPAEPITTVSAVHCGSTLASNNVILANPAELATAYSFRVSDGVNVVALDYRASRKMTLAETGLFGYGKTYTIQVSAILSTGAVTPYGPQCTVMSVPLPVTRLISSQCGTTINSLNTTLYALRLEGAEAYRFKVTDVTGLVQIMDRNNHTFALSLLPTSQYNMDYTIEIAVLRGTEWGAYGPACSIVAYQGGMNRITADTEDVAPVVKGVTLTAYPNPYTDVFTIEMDTQSEESVTILAFDMAGKLVEDITVLPSELTLQKLGSRYADGVYNVIVVQGSYQKSFKIVKK